MTLHRIGRLTSQVKKVSQRVAAIPFLCISNDKILPAEDILPPLYILPVL